MPVAIGGSDGAAASQEAGEEFGFNNDREDRQVCEVSLGRG